MQRVLGVILLVIFVAATMRSTIRTVRRINAAARRRKASREKIYRDGMICIRCGYNMRATPYRCSECGYRPGGEDE